MTVNPDHRFPSIIFQASLLLCLVFLAGGCAHPRGGETFIRGMGWSPWHAAYGWGRPADVVEQDYAILHDLHVNALRTWGPSSRRGADSYLAHGFFLLPQLRHPKTPRMAFADGKAGHPVYGDRESRAALAAEAVRVAAELKGHPGILGYNLGNEYSWVGQNAAGMYQCQGFDETTLGLFRQSLRARFGSVDRWRTLSGRNDGTFEEIVPPTGAGNDVLYWEWWRFQRETFGGYLAVGHAACQGVDPRTPTTYALLCGGRWDAATEDADLPFLGIQGDNLYYHWGKNWGNYAVRLARRIGPARPIYVTETGINTWKEEDPAASDRLMRQMFWVLALHPEVKGIFPFVYCDEWWHGPDPKTCDCSADTWGILTADRKPKSTYAAVRETYAEFERLNTFMGGRRSPVELLVSDQAVDRWKGSHGPSVDAVCDLLYRRGISFRLVSMLRPADLAATDCRRLLLIDSCLPDEPDGRFPISEALTRFEERGGEILVISDAPWQGIYRSSLAPVHSAARILPGTTDVWEALSPWFAEPRPGVEVPEETPVFWRILQAERHRYVLIVATGRTSPACVRLTHFPAVKLISPSEGSLTRTGDTWELSDMGVYALLRIDD